MTGLLITMVWSAALSQDIVRLSDGTEVTGKVLAHIVGEHLRLRMADGTFREIPGDSVADVTLDRRKRAFAMPVKGYYNHASWNFTLGNEFAMALGTNFNVVNGWQWNARWMAGLGIGIETMAFQRLLPIFADVRYNLMPKKGTAYVQATAGYSVSLGDDYYDGNWTSWWEKPHATNHGGLTAGLQLGYLNYWGKHIGFTVSGGIRYQGNKAVFPDVFFDGQQISFAHTERMRFLRFQTGIGLMFR